MNSLEEYAFSHWMLLVFASLFLGGWIHSFKCARGSRFEMYYLDFMIGMVCSAALFLLLQSVFSRDVFLMMKTVWHEKRFLATRAFFAGVLINLVNAFLLASTSFSGMSMTFLTVFGLGLMVDQGIYLYLYEASKEWCYFLSSFFLLLAISRICLIQRTIRLGAAKKTIFLSCMGGICLGLFYTLFDRSLDTPTTGGLTPGIASLFLSLGMIFCYLFLGPVLWKNPIFGHPLDRYMYYKTPVRAHFLGILGGVIWFTAICLKLYGQNLPHEKDVFFAVQFAPLLAYIGGIIFWKEIPKKLGYQASLYAIFSLYFLGVILMAYFRYGL
ncbi:MAG: hypothetical protein AAGI90_01255 [Chlamydiota bacterium]